MREGGCTVQKSLGSVLVGSVHHLLNIRLTLNSLGIDHVWMKRHGKRPKG
jgi:hypothetical protein